MDVVVWLRGLGLGQYEAAFRDNEIDETVLPGLTAEDLKELGIAALGHRRKLLDAIAALRADTKASPAPTPGPAAVDASPRDTAERRQVTVMFSDLVGSTALSARMDPEDLREIISAYQKSVAETVRRFGGFVAKYMGDGVLVYFGYPQAHEDDAERAVRAGLELVAAVSDLKTHAGLQTRVGISTGLVVVGDLIGSGASQEQAIVGETPNLAARLQGIAEPNSVVIAESTRKLVGNLFEFEDLGPKDLKGISGPVRAWAALRPASVESRFEAFHGTGLTELVGRDEELELLLRRWSKAKTGEGQVVLLSGEAGIGKSRLTAALLEHLATEPHTRLRYFCSPQHTDSALYPIISQMERAAGFAHNDNAQAKLDKLDNVLAQSFTSRQDAALFADLLSLPNDGRYPALELTPQQRRQRTLEALTAQIEALTRQSPVLMIFEDVHWIDPTSLEALDRAVDRIRILGVLLIITYRPEFEPPWIGRPYVTALNINRLGEREIAAMIDRVTGNKSLPASIRQDIIERTDGIPLFVEEMTKSLLEAVGAGAAERAVAAIPSPSVAVPASLHDSLMARLDRLPQVKRVAQLAACIGREFDYRTLLSVADLPEPKLESALERLSGAELVFRRGKPPDATYTFKHALVRDAAANSLLLRERRRVHAAILMALEGADTPRAPELLAQHAEAAGLEETAVERWMAAGGAAAARYANQEAVSHFERALRLLLGQAAGEARDRKELEILLALGVPQIAARGYASAEVERTYARARALCQQLGETEPLFFVLRGLWNCVFDRADLAQSLEIAELLLTLVSRSEDPEALALAHRALGATRLNRGEFDAALDSFQQSMSACRDLGESAGVRTYGEAPYIISCAYSGWVLTILGRLDEGQRAGEAALVAAHRCGNPLIVCFTSEIICHILINCREPQACVELAEAGRNLAEEHFLVFWMAGLTILLGWGLSHTGRLEEGIARMRDGIAAWKATGAALHVPTWNALLAEVLLEAGAADDAGAVIDESIETAGRNGDVIMLSILHRLKAQVLRRAGRLAQAEEQLVEARAIAARQRAKLFELQATLDLARLWVERGERRQAHDLLRPVYAGMPDGYDTADLLEAKELLKILGA